MKRPVYTLLLLLIGLSACKPEIVAPDQTESNLKMLQGGIWQVKHVDVNYFDFRGNPTGSQRFPFGEGTTGGICTFTYTPTLWQLDDNGDLFESAYMVNENIIETQGGGTWGIRSIGETNLELVLKSEAASPCDYNQSGAVYTLTRATR
jgi:hypothetical protein